MFRGGCILCFLGSLLLTGLYSPHLPAIVGITILGLAMFLADFWIRVGILALKDVAKATLTALISLGVGLMLLWAERWEK